MNLVLLLTCSKKEKLLLTVNPKNLDENWHTFKVVVSSSSQWELTLKKKNR